MEKIDQIALAALLVAVFAIALSSAAITWSISRTATMQTQVEQLSDEVAILEVRYTNLLAYLKARNINPENDY